VKQLNIFQIWIILLGNFFYFIFKSNFFFNIFIYIFYSFEKYSGNGTKSNSNPNSSDEVEPEENKGGAGFSEHTVKAGGNLDDVIDTLVKNFGEGSDYFKVLVNVFQSVLLTAEHDHLRTFYMIVPALCISWIEASLQAKVC
jgi:hypothetical protein